MGPHCLGSEGESFSLGPRSMPPTTYFRAFASKNLQSGISRLLLRSRGVTRSTASAATFSAAPTAACVMSWAFARALDRCTEGPAGATTAVGGEPQAAVTHAPPEASRSARLCAPWTATAEPAAARTAPASGAAAVVAVATDALLPAVAAAVVAIVAAIDVPVAAVAGATAVASAVVACPPAPLVPGDHDRTTIRVPAHMQWATSALERPVTHAAIALAVPVPAISAIALAV